MRYWRLWAAAATFALASLALLPVRLPAEELAGMQTVLQRLDEMERRLATRLDSAGQGDSPAAAGRTDYVLPPGVVCGGCGCVDCCCPGYWLEAGAEATYLQPTLAGQANSPTNPFDLEFDHEAAPRVWLGYRFDDGWGLRARYWQLDAEALIRNIEINPVGDDSGFLGGSLVLDALTVDVELTRPFVLREWYLEWVLGVRHAELRQTANIETFNIDGTSMPDILRTAGGQLQDAVDGTGLTTGIEARRPFGSGRLAFLVNGRVSMLWGHRKEAFTFTSLEFSEGAGELVLTDQQDIEFSDSDPATLWIAEIQFGLEWSQPYESFGGGLLFATAVLEWQGWGVTGSGGGDPLVDFFGPAFSAGFIR